MVKLVAVVMLAALVTASATAAPDSGRRSGGASAGGAAAAVSAQRTLEFAGLQWAVKSSGDALWGPGPNRFSDSPSNVWVDAQGRLHLAITFENGSWRCAEVIAQSSFGYGTYRFALESPVDSLDPNVVLGLFTWNDDPAFDHREIDIEFARWGNSADPTNAQYVVQPYDRNGNLRRWSLPAGAAATSHSFTWAARSIVFESRAGSGVLQRWSYTRRQSIPKPGGENPRINLWLFGGAPPKDGRPVEIVVSGFTFVR